MIWRTHVCLSSLIICRNLAAFTMLDTIRIKAEWPMIRPFRGKRILRCNPHLRIGINSTGDMIEMAEFSVPGILYGHNGRVIEDQEQIDAGLSKIESELGKIARVTRYCDWEASRVDIAWNFDLDAQALILAHAALRIPSIRRGAALFDNGVSWPSKIGRAPLAVKLYDKAREKHQSGSVLRGEIVLRGCQLRRKLPKQTWQNWDALWCVYREIMASIPTIPKVGNAKTWPDAVGRLPVEYRNQVLACFSHKPPRTRRDYRRRVETAAAQRPETFSWENILPLEGPPTPVHVIPRKTANQFHTK